MDKKAINQDGFTVIELIIVLAISAIMFSIILKYTGWFYPVENTWQYIFIYIFSYFLIMGVLFIIVLIFIVVLGKDDEKYLPVAFFSSIFMSFFIAYGSLLYFGISFPIDTKGKRISDLGQNQSLTSSEITDIDERAKSISESIKNIDQLTLSEITKIIGELSTFIEEYKEIASKQSEKIIVLEKAAIDANNKAEQAKKLLETIRSLTKPQLDAVKLLITEDATIQANRSFLTGVSLSFPIGIISSLIASWIMRKIKKDKLTKASSQPRSSAAEA